MQHAAALKKGTASPFRVGVCRRGSTVLKREAIVQAQRSCTSSTRRVGVVRSKRLACARHCDEFAANRYCADPRIVVHGFAARYQGINATNHRLVNSPLISLKRGVCMPSLKNRSSSHASRSWSRSGADAGNAD